MLHQKYAPESLSSRLLPRDQWQPYPTWADRDAWAALPAAVRQAHIARGEDALDFDWKPLPATVFLQFARIGNRRNFEKLHFARRGTLGSLVIAECVEGQGRFLDDIVNGMWAICEESYWGLPAHLYAQQAGIGLPDTAEPTVDLFAAETSALLAWSLYLLGDQLDRVSPLVRPRLSREIQTRILTPCFERDDFWWMGFGSRLVNNWNPWVNSNWLASALLVETDEARRRNTVAKIMRSLDRFIDTYPSDGGCDEGPSYWGRAGASLYDNLLLLRSASKGDIDVFDEPLIQEIGRFIYRVHIAENYYLNFADAPALVAPDPLLVFDYGQRIDDPQMMAHGAWLADRADVLGRGVIAARSDVPASLGRVLPALFGLEALASVEPTAPLVRDSWLPVIEVVTARDEAGSTAGFYVAAKGGHNAESHNHNDVGHFVVYLDGQPLLVDAGVETYTAKTFSEQRYEIWTMQSAYHALPTVNGVQQDPGHDFKAADVSYRADDAQMQFQLDLAPAYPAAAGIERWQRTLTFTRGRDVQLVDAYQLENDPTSLSLNLITPSRVEVGSGGVLNLQTTSLVEGRESAAGQIHYNEALFDVTVEEISIGDERLGSAWGERLFRIVFAAREPTQSDTWTLRITRA